MSLFAYFLVTATKKTPETLDHLQDSRSPDLRLDYYLIRSGVFMFQDIYCPVIMLVMGHTATFSKGANPTTSK